jgi:SpoVK/Ycf46/Vps4 family AAA+-type ATPase
MINLLCMNKYEENIEQTDLLIRPDLKEFSAASFTSQAIDTILKEMEDHRDDLAVIVAGYSDPMEKFIRSNPGLKSRFNRFVHFDDFSSEELFAIFQSLCKKNAYTADQKASELIKDHLGALTKSAGDDFANARTVRNFFETVIAKQATRISGEKDPSTELLSTITEADVTRCTDADSKAESLEDVLSELNSLIGLEMVKEEIADLIHVVEHQQRRKAQGLRIPSMSLHLVFMGNPGTGKTTVARYIARLYKSLGLLSKGHLVETDRSGLVAGYVGQTAIKTQDIINEAMGGVLFIDEAYTLNGSGSNDYGQEAIDTLLKAMEDKRDDFVVIVAGYPELMDNFVHSNPGLESRFNRYIHFEDYSADEMLRIFKMSCDKNQYVLTEAAETAVKDYFATVSISTIANGRGARNLFEKVVTQQAKRIASMSESHADELSTITEDDIKHALARGDK